MNDKDNSIYKKLYKGNKEQNIIISLYHKNNYNLIKPKEANEKPSEISTRINKDKFNIISKNHKNIFSFLLKAFIFLYFIYSVFSNNNKELPKMRNLNSEYSEITVTIQGPGFYKIINILDPLPCNIFIKGVDVTESATSDLKYNFLEEEEYTIVLRYNTSFTTCAWMFHSFDYVTKIDLSKFDSSKVTDTSAMFYRCSNLVELNLTNFNTSSVTDMHQMFLACSSMTSLDLSSFDTSNVINMSSLFIYDSELASVDLSSFDTSSVKDMRFMFMACPRLKSVNISNFNTQSLENMSGMFRSCALLTSVDLSSFDTSKVTDMANLFHECQSLTSIDLGNFDTSNVVSMRYMFYNCTRLTSLDISNFDMTNVEKISYMFQNCENLECLTLNNSTTLNSIIEANNLFYGCKKLESLDLSLLYTSAVTNMDYMFYNCESLKYLNLKNFDTSSVNSMINMFDGCKSLEYLNISSFIESDNLNMSNMFNSVSQNLKYCIKDNAQATNIIQLLYEKNIVNNCTDECLIENGKYIIEKNLCLDDCGEDEDYKFEYNNKCLSSCDNYYNYNYTGCLDSVPEGFYSNSSTLKTIDKCPLKCKLCSYDSIQYNLCISCSDSYSSKENDEKNIDPYINCYLNCPLGYININDLCEINSDSCDDRSLQYITVDENICIEECSSIDFLNKVCKTRYNSLDIKKNITDSLRNDIKSGKLSSLLSNITSGDKIDITIVDDDIIYQITSSDNQNNKNDVNDNASILKLKQCEDILKANNGISENETLIILKIDVYKEGLLMPVIEYEVYHPTEFYKLNLSDCDDLKIEISLPVSINEDELYKHDPSSDYYNDKCCSYTSDNGTDVILSDRQNEYASNNLSICEDNCELINYDTETKYASCNCSIKSDINMDDEEVIDKDKLLNSFIDLKSMMNLDILKCYYTLFTKDGLINNIGSYILLATILIFIISLIIFISKGYSSLIRQINLIINKNSSEKNKKGLNIKVHKNNTQPNIKESKVKKIKRNSAIIIGNSSLINKSKQNKNKIKENEKEKEKDKKNKKNKKRSETAPPKKKTKNNRVKNSTNTSINLYKDSKDSETITSNLKPLKENTMVKNLKRKNIKSSFSPKKNVGQGIKIYEEKEKKVDLNKSKNININININIKPKKTKVNTNTNSNLDLNDFEMNNLPYDKALKYDKRTYFKYYLSLIRTKHIFFFAFYPNNDYNSMIIKICLFFFSFALYYTVNCLFFNDDTVHDLNQNSGKFDFIYNLPQILYSTIISAFINMIIKFFSLTEKNILKLKSDNNAKNYNKTVPKLIKCLKIKFICFFSISFLLLIFFWYYLSCFCAVYKNTQIYVIEDTLISFGLSLLYPFGLNLFPGFFRIPSLRDKNKSKETIYKLSKMIQLI